MLRTSGRTSEGTARGRVKSRGWRGLRGSLTARGGCREVSRDMCGLLEACGSFKIAILGRKLAVLSPFRTVGRLGSATMVDATNGPVSSRKLTSPAASEKGNMAEVPVLGSVSCKPASESRNLRGQRRSRPIRKRCVLLLITLIAARTRNGVSGCWKVRFVTKNFVSVGP